MIRPAPRQFPARVLRSGWVGEESVSQPMLDDRIRSIVSNETVTSFEFAARIMRITHDGLATTYHLVSGITIVAPRGAQIFWEEK